MKYALVFLSLSLACGLTALGEVPLVLRWILWSSSVAFAGVGLAYAGLGPRAFLKQADGRLHPLSYLLYWPFHLLNALSLLGFRLAGKEHAFDAIDSRVYLGCRLSQRDLITLAPLGLVSVLDLTTEFSELPALRSLQYRCIPLLDTGPPTLAQLQDGAAWIQAQATHGPVYVHCALGHGRSATFAAAYLLVSDQAQDASEAVRQLQARRPKIGLSRGQMAVLEKFSALARVPP